MKTSEQKTIIISIEEKNGKLILNNGIGQRWEFPDGFSRNVAIASLVYEALMNSDKVMSGYSNRYKISMKVETLIKEK